MVTISYTDIYIHTSSHSALVQHKKRFTQFQFKYTWTWTRNGQPSKNTVMKSWKRLAHHFFFRQILNIHSQTSQVTPHSLTDEMDNGNINKREILMFENSMFEDK